MMTLFRNAIHQSRSQNRTNLLALVALAVFLMPVDAHAQTLGAMMCTISFNIAPFEPFMSDVAYIVGACMIGIGLMQMAFYTDVMNQGRQYGISRPKGYMLVGAALLAFPAFLAWCINTLFTQDNGGGLRTCIPGAVISDGEGGLTTQVGLDGLMLNLVDNIKNPMVFMLSVMSIIIGIFLVMRGLIRGAKFGQDAKVTVPFIIANLVIGTLLYTLGANLNMVMTSVFGDPSIASDGNVISAIAADFGKATVPFQNGVYAALTFFQMVGMIAFIRGWLILKAAAEGDGQKTVAQGLTHILGGVLAINIYRFLETMDSTFGTGFLS